MKLTIDSKFWLVFALGFFVAALTHWNLPYEELDLMGNGVAYRWIAYSGVISLIAHLRYQVLSGRVAFWTAIGFIAAVFLRIIYDLFRDSSTHNLWPFEILLAFVLTFLPAFIVGWVFKYLKGLPKS